MPTASNSTKLKATDVLDTRPAIFGRTVTSTFRKMFSFKHQPPGNLRTGMIPPVVFGTLFWNLPKLLKLRCYLKKRDSLHASPWDAGVSCRKRIQHAPLRSR